MGILCNGLRCAYHCGRSVVYLVVSGQSEALAVALWWPLTWGPQICGRARLRNQAYSPAGPTPAHTGRTPRPVAGCNSHPVPSPVKRLRKTLSAPERARREPENFSNSHTHSTPTLFLPVPVARGRVRGASCECKRSRTAESADRPAGCEASGAWLQVCRCKGLARRCL